MLKKITLISSVILLASSSIVSCKKDVDTPKSICMTCTQKVESYIDGELISTANVGGQEYCGEQLSTILANPSITVEQTIGGFTQSATTTFTCQ